MSVFNQAIDAIYADPNFGLAAQYTPPGPVPPDPIDCRAIFVEPDIDVLAGIGVTTAQRRIDVRVSEVATAAEGGIFTIGSERYKVTKVDQPDTNRLLWRCWVIRV